MGSGFTRKSLGRRLAEVLDEKAARGELAWSTATQAERLVYVIEPGAMWADTKPPTLFLTPGEAAEWCGIDLLEG